MDFPFLISKWDTTSLSMERELGKYDIFNRQIQEDMKYRAPVDFTLEVINRFKPISDEMKEAAHTVDLLKNYRSYMTNVKNYWMKPLLIRQNPRRN